MWRAPEGPEGTGGLRGAAPNEVRTPSLAGGRALRRPEHPWGSKQQHAARTAGRRPRAHKQPGQARARAAAPVTGRDTRSEGVHCLRIGCSAPNHKSKRGICETRARLRRPWAAAGPGRASSRRAEPDNSDLAPLVWRAPEGPEGTGGLRGAAPNEVRTPSLAGGRALRRPEHPWGHKQQHAARTASGRAAAHGRIKQPGPQSQLSQHSRWRRRGRRRR